MKTKFLSLAAVLPITIGMQFANSELLFAGEKKNISPEQKEQAQQSARWTDSSFGEWMHNQPIQFLENKGQFTDADGSRNKISHNPFGTNVFVENHGQFNKWIKSENPDILFGVNNGERIFFTRNSLIFKMDKTEKKTDAEEEIDKDEEMSKGQYEESEKKKYAIKNYYVQLEWMGSNKDVSVEGKDKANGYYTFGEKGYESVRAHGYERLLYKNLYNGIDVEYSVPSADSNGIKYKIIIHPGGNYQNIRMRYGGDVKEININHEGNAVIETAVGQMLDHAPHAFYLESGKPAAVKFIKDENGYLYFDFPKRLEEGKTVIIDPWLVTPATLTTNNRAYDVDFDDYGNVYIGGGRNPYKLAKYDANGNLLWTYAWPSGFSSTNNYKYYTEFGLIRKSGSVYIGEGINVNNPPRVIKLNSNGTQVFMQSINNATNNEIWTIFYNPCNGKMLGFGGGVKAGSMDNLYLFSDTNLTNTAMVNSNGAAGACCNDITDAIIDFNGDFYGLTVSDWGIPFDNYVFKSLQSNSYNVPPAFNIYTGYTFDECGCISSTFPDIGVANALALNTNYLFGYDGETIKAWDKTNGVLLGSIVVNASYIGGLNRAHQGIAVDECNNVYAGGYQAVHTYVFNGSNFTSSGNITTNVPDEVYDVMLNEGSGILYVSGRGFLSTISVSQCTSGLLTVTTAVTPSCSGMASATVTVTGGAPPYTYQWSNGSTTNVASNLSNGTYTVIVWDGSCIKKTAVDMIIITGGLSFASSVINATCLGGNNGTAAITASGGSGNYTYTWSNGQSASTATGLSAGTFTVLVSDANNCTQTATVAVTQSGVPTAVAGTTATILSGSSTSLTASGGVTYSWAPSTGLNCNTCANPVASPTVTIEYCVYVFDTAGCFDSACVTVFVVEPLDCLGSAEREFFLPNAFSPNGDGENDVLKIYYGDIRCIETCKLVIYNRWGEKVFEYEGTPIPLGGAGAGPQWDGKYKGRIMNSTVVVYYMKAEMRDGKEIIKKGNVSIVQ